MGIVIRMLGGFQVSNGGASVLDADWRPAKAAAIVKILALQPGRTLHRDQLIDLLWPDADAEAGASNFYKNLHHLRTALRSAGAPELVALHRGAVSLAGEAELDVDEFRDLGRRALATGELGLFEQAIVASSGDLLPGDLYEPWTEPHREELRALRLALQLGAGDRHLQRRRYDDAIIAFRQATLTSPISEEAHRGLMRAYSMSGQRDLALAQFDRCVEVFEAELGAAPAEETRALADDIRSVDRLATPVDLAIAAPVAAADAAMRRRDWSEAQRHYRSAIDALHAAGADDEREADLWMALSRVASANTGSRDIGEFARTAATIARRAGSFDLESRALVQFQAATDALPNNHAAHRESAELIESALERLPPGPSAARARLLAAGARPAAAAARSGDERHITGRVSIAGVPDDASEQHLREAVAIARASGDRDVLAFTILRLRTYITSPDTLDERLALTGELSDVPRGHAVTEFETHLMRHEDLLEHGDIDGARIEARGIQRIGETMGIPAIRAAGLSCLATHATADGELHEAMSLLFESRKADATYGNNSNSQYRFGIQFFIIRWHQGRLAELYDPYVRAVDLAPRLSAPRASLALMCAESGRVDEGREHLRHLTAGGVSSIARDYLWWLNMVFLSRAAAVTEDRPVAEELYALMSPFAARNASTSGAASYGSAALHLARLAAFLGDGAAAREHFEHALEFNTRTRQRTWTAYTRHDYARFLAQSDSRADLARSAELARIAEGDAREIGLPSLLGQGEAPLASG